MLHRISVFDLPNLSDEHYGDRDLALFTHTSPTLRRYRDCFVEHYGPDFAYERLFGNLHRALRNHFHEVYAKPFFTLRASVIDLTCEATMNATLAAANMMIGNIGDFNEKIETMIAELAEDPAEIPIIDDDHPIVPLRRLYALLGAEVARIHVPFAPRVAEILSRSLGSEYVVPWHEPRYELFRPDTMREIRRITDNYGLDKATEVIKGMLPPEWGLGPEWDIEALINEVFAEIVSVYFSRCNDDAYMETIADQMRPELDPYLDPRDKYYQDLKSFMPALTDEQFERCLQKRMTRVRSKHLIYWIALAESCGHAIDMTWIEIAPDKDEAKDAGQDAARDAGQDEASDPGQDDREP
jgi:hypothetical protein